MPSATSAIRVRLARIPIPLLVFFVVGLAIASAALASYVHWYVQPAGLPAAQTDCPVVVPAHAGMKELRAAGDVCAAKAIVAGWSRDNKLDDARKGLFLDLAVVAIYTAALTCGIYLVWSDLDPRYRNGARIAWVMLAIAALERVAADIVLLMVVPEHKLGKSPAWKHAMHWAPPLAAWLRAAQWPLLVVTAAFAVFGVCVRITRTLVKESRSYEGLDRVAADVLTEVISADSIEVQWRDHGASVEPMSRWQRISAWARAEDNQPCMRPHDRPVPQPGAVGICCSGGGIRSSAYNLGALQVLDENKEYEGARFLAGVSGGSYIASALTLGRCTGDGASELRPFAAGSPEELYLRNHSSYLALGFGGKFYAVHRALRGLLFNLTLVGLALYLIALPLGWLFFTRMDPAGMPAQSLVQLIPARTPILVRVASGTTIEVRDSPGALPRNVALKPDSTISVTAPGYRVRAHARVTIEQAQREIPKGSVVPVSVGRSVELAGQDVSLYSTSDPELPQNISSDLSGSVIHLAAGSTLFALPGTTVTVTADVLWNSQSHTIDRACGSEPCVRNRTLPWVLPAVFGLIGLGLLLGLVDLVIRPYDVTAHMTEAWSIRLLNAAGLVFVLGLVLPELIERLLNTYRDNGVHIGGVAAGSAIAMWGGIVAALIGTARPTFSEAEKSVQTFIRKATPRLRAALLHLAAYVAGPLLLIVATVTFATLGARLGWTRPAASGLILAAGFLLTIWSVGDLTRWSLHPFYRRQLASAYMLERDANGDAVCAKPRDTDVPIYISELAPGKCPELIVCAAANISTAGATPPQRNATTFTFTRDGAGGDVLGYIPMRRYESISPSFKRDITLPTAVAASGAAFSPSMGKMTKPAFRFLMALGNARLGVWFPNPGYLRKRADFAAKKFADNERAEIVKLFDRHARDNAEKSRVALLERVRRGMSEEQRRALSREHPHVADVRESFTAWLDEHCRATRTAMFGEFCSAFLAGKEPNFHYGAVSPTYLFNEMFNHHQVDDKFIYISDGGHFENLGFVELLRRGCTQVFCFDASGGPPADFTTLGQAVALADSELGVTVDIDPSKMVGTDGKMVDDHVVGSIHYPGSTVRGVIVYARAALIDGAPADVKAYAARDPAFPNDPTFDQLYTDQRFDAYRRLGRFTADRVCTAMQGERTAQGLPRPTPIP